MRAKTLLKVTWTKAAPGQTYTEDGVLADYRTIAADWSKPGIEMVKKGDADAALKGAAKVMTAEYFSEHVSHVCMEPLNATVQGRWRQGRGLDRQPGAAASCRSLPRSAPARRRTRSAFTPVARRRLRPAFGRRRRAACGDARQGGPGPSGEDDLEPVGRHAERQVPPADARSASRSGSTPRAISSAGVTASSTRPISAASCRRRCSRRSACTTWSRAAAANELRRRQSPRRMGAGSPRRRCRLPGAALPPATPSSRSRL